MRIFLILAFGILITTSCKKEEASATKVIRDCTGTYLRFDSKDWRVCNFQMIADKPEGTIIDVTYKKVEYKDTDDCAAPVCAMVHPYAIGPWINIIKIK